MDKSIVDILNDIYRLSVELIINLRLDEDISDPVIIINNCIELSVGKKRKILKNLKEVRNKSAHMGIITSYNIRMLEELYSYVNNHKLVESILEKCEYLLVFLKAQNLPEIGTYIQILEDSDYAKVGIIRHYTFEDINSVEMEIELVDNGEFINMDNNCKYRILDNM